MFIHGVLSTFGAPFYAVDRGLGAKSLAFPKDSFKGGLKRGLRGGGVPPRAFTAGVLLFATFITHVRSLTALVANLLPKYS